MFAIVGVGAAALLTATALAPNAAASSSGSDSAESAALTAVMNHHGGVAARSAAIDAKKKGQCGTKIGRQLKTPDGLISWNDTSGTTYDTAGAADFYCKKKTRIRAVQVYGFYGTPGTDTFNVTFYRDDGGVATLHEPDDSIAPICSFTNIVGPTGSGASTLTTLSLGAGCVVPPGVSWVSVQNNDAAGPWYWEMQPTQGGLYGPDWRDVHDIFTTGCISFHGNPTPTTGGGDEYLLGCTGYTYADWRFMLL